ncbi:oxygenase MpaB family protein [Patulibacter defluvii]|uniref:oxygenase MpaB family protein n=1 Tax=Patulibacter defluvii TaxID=3095358 RepID=UPI002A754F36|nr:oxygenase MpaB family protein [Patulibacter sp. DM4]
MLRSLDTPTSGPAEVVDRAALLPDEALVARLAAGRHEGDPLADAVVAAFAELPGGVGFRRLDAALDALPGRLPESTPAAVRALVEQAASVPPRVDLDLVDAGATSFWRVGAPALFVSLLYGSLAFGYQYADLSRPLVATGRLERMASRRIGETARWALAVTRPGGMHPGGEGWKTSIRVRIVHALVRARLRRSPDWRPEWGTPISATGMMATAIGGFHIIPERALHDMGAHANDADREARTALWRWVGFVMGVPEDLLPANAREAERLMTALESFFPGPSEEGPRLMRALTHHGLPLEGAIPRPLVTPLRTLSAPLVASFIRRWLGDEMADQLGLARSPLRHLFPLTRPVVRAHAVLLALGALGDERTAATAQIHAIDRLLDLAGDPKAPVAPGAVVG